MPTVCLIRPTGYPHAEALAELEETVRYGLEALGVWGGPPRIVLGAHLPGYEPLPTDIIYNTEHPRSGWWGKEYRDLMRSRETWDYSPSGYGLHVPIGYVPQLTRIEKADPQDIDVLFYGSINDRRAKVIAELRQTGLEVVNVFGVYGKERDALIARAKVVLNMHYYEPGEFESVRVSYLLANHKAVVCEHSGEPLDASPGYWFVGYIGLVHWCLDLVEDVTARYLLEKHGPEHLRSEADILQEALCGHL